MWNYTYAAQLVTIKITMIQRHLSASRLYIVAAVDRKLTWNPDFTRIDKALHDNCLVRHLGHFSVNLLSFPPPFPCSDERGFWVYTLELSSNWTRLLVGCWLFCLQNLPCLVSSWCMRGVSVEVWTKNILYRFMKSQTHFSTSWHTKMSLTLHEPI
jgi:hypothetical protein